MLYEISKFLTPFELFLDRFVYEDTCIVSCRFCKLLFNSFTPERDLYIPPGAVLGVKYELLMASVRLRVLETQKRLIFDILCADVLDLCHDLICRREIAMCIKRYLRHAMAARAQTSDFGVLAGKEDRNLPPAQSGALPGWPLLASELGDRG